jgi:hypothetical protein
VAGDDATAAREFDPADLRSIAFESHRDFIRRFLEGRHENTA